MPTDAATKTSCEELECANSEIIRTRADVEDANIFIGPMASADTVMRAGETREALAEKGEVIGFEMEGSGACFFHPCKRRSMLGELQWQLHRLLLPNCHCQ